jgi:hypothetical protein
VARRRCAAISGPMGRSKAGRNPISRRIPRTTRRFRSRWISFAEFRKTRPTPQAQKRRFKTKTNNHQNGHALGLSHQSNCSPLSLWGRVLALLADPSGRFPCAPAPTVKAAVSPRPVYAPGLRMAAADPLRACSKSPARPPAAWRYHSLFPAEWPRVGL